MVLGYLPSRNIALNLNPNSNPNPKHNLGANFLGGNCPGTEWNINETSEFAVELRKTEEKDKVIENSYAMFQIREAVDLSQMFFKIGLLKSFANFLGKHQCWSLFSIKLQGWKGLELYYKETPTLVFPCEICEIFNNTFFFVTPPVAAFQSFLLWLAFCLKQVAEKKAFASEMCHLHNWNSPNRDPP